jgi:hypothetical protein
MDHGSEFDDLERLAVLADSPLAEEYRPSGLQPHCERTEEKNWARDHQRHGGPDSVKYWLTKASIEPASDVTGWPAHVAFRFCHGCTMEASFDAMFRGPMKL